MPASNGANPWVEVGEINGVFGVKGWVKVFSHTRPREDILGYNPWYLWLNGQWNARRVVSGKSRGGGIVAALDGCEDRDEALVLKGTRIAIAASQLKPVDEDEFYWRDLIGLKVVDHSGIDFGLVTELMETGANDVMVLEDGSLIPFTRQTVLSVDMATGVIQVDWEPDSED